MPYPTKQVCRHSKGGYLRWQFLNNFIVVNTYTLPEDHIVGNRDGFKLTWTLVLLLSRIGNMHASGTVDMVGIGKKS